jgi:methylphosphotriester-DNA--protein-cysteine methyltransferase
MSVSHFHACFVKEVGMAPMEYAHRARLKNAQKMLALPGASVTDIASKMGYCSSQHLAACFKRYLGMTPTKARKTTAV